MFSFRGWSWKSHHYRHRFRRREVKIQSNADQAAAITRSRAVTSVAFAWAREKCAPLLCHLKHGRWSYRSQQEAKNVSTRCCRCWCSWMWRWWRVLDAPIGAMWWCTRLPRADALWACRYGFRRHLLLKNNGWFIFLYNFQNHDYFKWKSYFYSKKQINSKKILGQMLTRKPFP